MEKKEENKNKSQMNSRSSTSRRVVRLAPFSFGVNFMTEGIGSCAISSEMWWKITNKRPFSFSACLSLPCDEAWVTPIAVVYDCFSCAVKIHRREMLSGSRLSFRQDDRKTSQRPQQKKTTLHQSIRSRENRSKHRTANCRRMAAVSAVQHRSH